MSQDINALTITGNLTRDVELRAASSGVAIANLRIANNGRRKDAQTQQWVDKPRYFNVVVFGKDAENCAQYLAKGSRVAIKGELDWREYDDKQNPGKKREAIEIKADQVLFLDPRGQNAQAAPQQTQAPAQQPYAHPAQPQYAPQPAAQPAPVEPAPAPVAQQQYAAQAQQPAAQPAPVEPAPAPVAQQQYAAQPQQPAAPQPVQQQPQPVAPVQPPAAPVPVGAGSAAGQNDLPF